MKLGQHRSKPIFSSALNCFMKENGLSLQQQQNWVKFITQNPVCEICVPNSICDLLNVLDSKIFEDRPSVFSLD